MNSKKVVCIIGAFPPPMHGLALVNDAMKNLIIAHEPKSHSYDINSISLNRSVFNIGIRFLKFLYIIPQILFLSIVQRYHSLYIGLSGGCGQIYDLFFLIIARITRQTIIIHHHSFSYLININNLTKFLVWVSGKNALHIVLCNRMNDLLKSYKNNITTTVLSNSIFLKQIDVQIDKSPRIKTIGYLGNISFEKGIKDFIKTIDILNIDYNIKGIIAGPFQNKLSENYTINSIKNMTNISYVGAIYKDKKYEFLKTIDVLLMPSKLEEAEPIVIHEAMSFGIPVIAYNKGCIDEIIPAKTGKIIDEKLIFVNEAIEKITSWINSPKSFSQSRLNSFNNFQDLKKVSKVSLENILDIIVNHS